MNLPFIQKKSVSQVLAVFEKTIQELQQVEDAQRAEEQLQQQKIAAATSAGLAAMQEAERAKTVRSKLLSLVGSEF